MNKCDKIHTFFFLNQAIHISVHYQNSNCLHLLKDIMKSYYILPVFLRRKEFYYIMH